MTSRRLRATLLGLGAMNSPRYAPAGLLVSFAGRRLMFDGGPGGAPRPRVDAWLLSDERAEPHSEIRRLGAQRGVVPRLAGFDTDELVATPLPVEHTSHPTVGYRIQTGTRVMVWAPEFWAFPAWAAGADLMFADAAGWTRPIRFAHRTGGHASVHDTARTAARLGVQRLVFAISDGPRCARWMPGTSRPTENGAASGTPTHWPSLTVARQAAASLSGLT